ncbi:NitT/TauT family transport system substrate-binding protein [Xanthobacter flavus]|uniref:Putative aliphatic sulfonates-binding protein n=1 Tax=Xanthobacter flavus TaxID=281 RepID=A0A9W6CJS0_XANFL|nr:ABC transporter substrate-binding protein [Xanthobacter flavus]MDR6333703.1 NitT/TauT family transport system substrate-binding protein [Xanthobacter flavus]GLI20544.1 ABC transporter substrate-binding protein [Xanthobacter flavus]
MNPFRPSILRAFALALATSCAAVLPVAAETINIGIGTQDTTTNTVTTGVVIKELKLLDKYLPKDGKYAGATYNIEWQNFTSGPPVTNGMMADKLQFGGMGDYPLVVNGYTFQSNPQSKSQLVAVAAYNIYGSGNGVVVHKDSPYFELSDLKGKVLSVPFGSAAHGMILKAMQDKNWPADYFKLVSQSPEVGSTNLQEKKIDAHADFVPFAELLPFRGFARKIFDGVETNAPTWHGVVVRTDFAEKYPEVVVGYIKAVIEANDWVRKNPKEAAEKIAKWTGIDKEVVYIFLGPGGIMTMDPTIKPQLVEDAAQDAAVLQKLGRMKEFDVKAWVNDTYVRQAYKELGLDYEAQLKSLANYEIAGDDSFCKVKISEPRKAGEIWVEGEGIKPYSSAACTLGALAELNAAGKKINMTYLFDTARGIKLFATDAFYAVSTKDGKTEIQPFMLKADAEAAAAKAGGKVLPFADALKAASGARG